MTTVLNVDALRREMFRKGLDRAALGRKAKVSRPTLSKIFAKKAVSDATALRVARAIEQEPEVIDLALLERRAS